MKDRFKISNNTFVDGGTGISANGSIDVEISGNNMINLKTGIEVDESFMGTIEGNHMRKVEEGIVVKKINPYDYFGISKDISIKDLYCLFQELDAHHPTTHEQITKDSLLANVDHLTSIAERIANFTKVYGPVLVTTFGPYFSGLL